jgi:uncharacterized membrane protein SirB2
MWYEWLRHVHVTCALATGLLFIIRGVWMMADSPKLKTPALRVMPHAIDTVLLVSALGMLAAFGINPFAHPWLVAKFVALVLYIGFGLVAFRFGKTKPVRIVSWLLAVLMLVSIYGFAFTKRVMFW